MPSDPGAELAGGNACWDSTGMEGMCYPLGTLEVGFGVIPGVLNIWVAGDGIPLVALEEQ